MAINFPSNPSNGQQVTLAGTTYTYNSAKTKWEIRNPFTSSVFDSAEVVSLVDSSYVSSRQEAAGVTVYANRSSLPASGNTAGDQAYVTANNRLYIWNGTGWYSIALLNLAPSIQSVLDSDNNQSPFSLAIDGTPTTITITAVDSDGDSITYGYSADSNFGGLATLSQANNVFTITPFSQDSATTTSGTITFTATDTINVASSGVQTFTLNFLSALWDETVLSIGASSTNSLDNSTFIDRSTTATTVTKYDAPIQTVFHPYLDNWSVKFDGSSDFFSTTMTETIGTGDFTIEAYVNHTGGTDDVIISTAGCSFVYGITGQLRFYTGTGQNLVNSGVSYISNRWVHVAAVRTSGVLKMFQDGTEIYSAAYTHNIASFGSSYIGKYHASNVAYFGGNISNLRIVVGSALYTSNFTPSIEKLTAVSGTSLLTCQSNRFIDNSTNNHTITINGDPKISAFNPFGQGSEYAVSQNKGSYYNPVGTSGYLQRSNIAFGTDDFTIQFWFYMTAAFTNNRNFFGQSNGGGSTPKMLCYVNGSNLTFEFGSLGGAAVNYASSNFKPYEWYHMAFVREGTGTDELTMYVNGVSVDTGQVGDTSACTGNFRIGQVGESESYFADDFFQGYISDFYVSKTAEYTTAFTPPASPVGNTNADLYLPMDNAGIFDKTGNNTMTLTGNTVTSTTQTKFANTAIYFDGSGDMAETSYSFNNISNYTVEYWVYWTNKSGYNQIWSNRRGGNGFGFYINSPNYALASNTAVEVSFGTPAANQWVHIAHVWSSGSLKTYINGSLVNTYTDGRTMTSNTTYILSDSINSTHALQGYIENFQVLQTEKYTTNFTPPTQTQGRLYQAED